MKKHNIGTCQSLGTSPSTEPSANHHHHRFKGWSSERVPHPTTSANTTNRRRTRRHTNSTLTPPFYNGSRRQLPSKWEDAERWINCSPVVGYGVAKNTIYTYSHQQRRPKSKSGPILPPGMVAAFEGGGGRSFLGNGSSPFTTGVFMGYRVGVGVGQVENVAPCSSLLGWPDLVSDSSLPTSRDEKLEDINAAENAVTQVISRRDMATQMSPPRSSSHSSPGVGSSSPPSILPIVELESDHNAKLDIKEVQVDKRATVVSWSGRHSSWLTTKALPGIDDCSRNPRDRCSWDISEAVSDFSKLQREEAKITAWENLQKAKAEAAMRKLEMKLEKTRSSSMDKILNKLKTAQSKAQEMRSSMTIREDLQTSKRLLRITCSRKSARLSSLWSCFTSHAL